jgi:hypothetical protein
MTRWLAAGLLFLGWHFATTFFMPAGTPRAEGWVVWPFGRDTRPALGRWQGILTPKVIPADPGPTAALALAGIASVGFLIGLAALFGILVPTDWWSAAVLIASLASGGLFLLYLGRWAIVPLLVDAVLLWGVLLRDWSVDGLAVP